MINLLAAKRSMKTSTNNKKRKIDLTPGNLYRIYDTRFSSTSIAFLAGYDPTESYVPSVSLDSQLERVEISCLPEEDEFSLEKVLGIKTTRTVMMYVMNVIHRKVCYAMFLHEDTIFLIREKTVQKIIHEYE